MPVCWCRRKFRRTESQRPLSWPWWHPCRARYRNACAQHLTLPTVANIGLEHRPVVIIRSGAAAPVDVFTSVQYRQTWFWIAEDDFDSKVAFTVVEILLALARTENAPGAIVTIPAR